jgi:hypothetical protein
MSSRRQIGNHPLMTADSVLQMETRLEYALWPVRVRFEDEVSRLLRRRAATGTLHRRCTLKLVGSTAQRALRSYRDVVVSLLETTSPKGASLSRSDRRRLLDSASRHLEVLRNATLQAVQDTVCASQAKLDASRTRADLARSFLRCRMQIELALNGELGWRSVFAHVLSGRVEVLAAAWPRLFGRPE